MTFQIADEPPWVIIPGQMITFKRDTVHAIPEIRRGAAVFLTLDTPRRTLDDVVFVEASALDRDFVSCLVDYE